MEKENIKLSIIIPVYNSQETIGSVVEKLIELIEGYKIEIILVDDGSKDNSYDICVKKYHKYPDTLAYIKLSKNFSVHNAIMAGLNSAKGDYALIMGDDFKDSPTEAVKIASYMFKNQFDVLYAKYDKNEHNWFRSFGDKANDWVSSILLDKPRDLYLSGFKCINRFVIDEVIKYDGPYPYVDGLILRFTRNIGEIEVKQEKRSLVKSGYALHKILSLWFNMFINFSNMPLRTSFFLGSILSIVGVLLMVYLLLDKYIFHPQSEFWPLGWTTLLVCIVIFSGSQLISLGLLGEYLGKLSLTSNKTPQFVVRDFYGRIRKPK